MPEEPRAPEPADDAAPQRGSKLTERNPRTGLFKLRDVPWDDFLKRYVWDDETTPYFVPVARLTRRQADSELRAYTVFLAFLFGVAAVITLSAQAPGGRSPGMSLFSFTVVCATVLLATTRLTWAAMYLCLAPIGSAFWILVSAGHEGLGAIDHLVIIVFCVFWLRYTLRVIRITREYDAMPPGSDPPGTRRRWGRRR